MIFLHYFGCFLDRILGSYLVSSAVETCSFLFLNQQSSTGING